MAYRDIRIIGDPVLRTQCEWITDIDDSVKALVEDLLETVDDDGRAGLAANQIGVGMARLLLERRWTDRLHPQSEDRRAGLRRISGRG